MQLTVAQRKGPSAAKPPTRPLTLSLRFPKNVFLHARAVTLAIRNPPAGACVEAEGQLSPGALPKSWLLPFWQGLEQCRTTTLGTPRRAAAGEGRTLSLLCFRDVPE